MNQLCFTILWCALQITLLGVLAVFLYEAVRRLVPAAASLIVLVSLTMIVTLTVLTFCPWPSWWPVVVAAAQSDELKTEASSRESETKENGLLGGDAKSAEDSAATDHNFSASEASDSESAVLFLQAWMEEFSRETSKTSGASPRRWPMVLTTFLLAASALGLIHLVLGLLSVRGYRLRSQPIQDAALLELLDLLRGEQGCRQKVELRESEELTTAAAVGWRRPLILLPPEWTQWTPQERRAVLAHELAHIGGWDYLASVVGQVSLALHFYHPLVHWLTRRLRLEQELAADAAGARATGGQKQYLMILAEMALRQSERPMGWPARTFLPTRGAFLRRIEMLRDAKKMPTTLSATGRVCVAGVVILLALGIAGLRSPSGDLNIANAQSPGKETSFVNLAQDNEPFDLSYTTGEGRIVIAIRPAAILAALDEPDLGKLITENFESLFTALGIKASDVQQVILNPSIIVPVKIIASVEGDAMMLRSSKPLNVKNFIETGTLGVTEVENTSGGKSYYRGKKGDRAIFFPDDRTLVFDSERNIRRYASGRKARTSLLKEGWDKVAKEHLAIAIDSQFLEEQLSPLRKLGGGHYSPRQSRMMTMLAPFTPLWKKSERLFLGASLGEELKLHAVAKCDSTEDAREVKETAQAAITLGGNALKQLKEPIGAISDPSQRVGILALLLQSGLNLVKNKQIKQTGKTVELQTATAFDAGLLTAVTEATLTARTTSRRVASSNNLKMIAIAFHNFHDTYRHFPAAKTDIKRGFINGNNLPKYKHPVSWRVQILPFVKGAAIYDAWKFDEPWDSEHNMKLAKQMPAVFRHSNAPKDSIHTSYFALTGEETVFSGDKGTQIREILDGTSNTILVVEAKREVIWTKPEDIPYAADKPLPKLGGFSPGIFQAALCDGAVRALSEKIDEKTLRSIITKDGGEVLGQY